jgi:transposase
MATSLLYHAFGLKGVKYIRTKCEGGRTIFYAETTSTLEQCPLCQGSRFLLLANYEKLFDEKQARLNTLLEANRPLFTMYTMKEQFRDFWQKSSLIEASKFVDAWCTDAENSAIKQLTKLAKTLKAYSYGLFNYFLHKISCGPIEGKIKTLKRQAYGYRDMAYFKLRLYHLHSQAYSLTG